MTFGRQDGLASTVRSRRGLGAPRGHLHSGTAHHRGQVHVADVVGPVDVDGIKIKCALIIWMQTLVKRQQAIYPENGFGFGVCAVQLHIRQRPFRQRALLLQLRGQVGLATTYW